MDETNSSSHLIERLCRLFGSYDETVISVMPFRGGGAVCETEMWVTPSGTRRVKAEFVSGMTEYEDSFKLMLRYPSVCPADRLGAAELLEKVMAHGTDGASEYGLRIAQNGYVQSESSDSEGVYSLPFSVRHTAKTDEDAVTYYIAFPESYVAAVGVGVTRFTENVKTALFTRRHIHESFMRSDECGVTHSFDFEFDSSCSTCALLPLLHGVKSVRIYKVLPTGEAQMTECILSNIIASNGKCSGTLTARGDVTAIRLDESTGTFMSDRMEAVSEVIT